MTNKLENAFIRISKLLKKLYIDYEVSGWFAVAIYGSNRPIADIDINIHENDFDTILPHIRRYIIFWPAQYQDSERDLRLITLCYEWQEIDLCGANGAKIYNKKNSKRQTANFNFRNFEIHTISWMKTKVSSPRQLLEYKSKILREVDLQDIQFLKEYINKHK